MSTRKSSPKQVNKETVNLEQNIPLELISELHRAFDFFNDKLAQNRLPRPMLVVSSAGKMKAHGWFVGEGWKLADVEISEITLCGESFCRGIDDVLNTMVHEMAHMKNYYDNDCKVVDCTAQQRHNNIFRKTAEDFGLIVTSSKRFGPAHTECGPQLKKMIKEFQPNAKLFELYRNMKLKEKKEKEKKEQKLKPVMISGETKELIEKSSKALGLTQKEFAGSAVQLMATMEERIKNATMNVMLHYTNKKKPTGDEIFQCIYSHICKDVKMKGDAKPDSE